MPEDFGTKSHQINLLSLLLKECLKPINLAFENEKWSYAQIH